MVKVYGPKIIARVKMLGAQHVYNNDLPVTLIGRGLIPLSSVMPTTYSTHKVTGPALYMLNKMCYLLECHMIAILEAVALLIKTGHHT
jgi:hypothetical protein